MSSALSIRPGMPGDVPLILGFIQGLARYERLEHLVVATEDSLREALFGAHPGAEVLLAFRGEQAVGFALFFHNFSTFLGQPGIYLEDLFVKSEYRGKGYGKELLATLAKVAVERGCGRLEWAVLDWNTPAIGFYESLGARANGDWTVYRLTGEALQKLGS